MPCKYITIDLSGDLYDLLISELDFNSDVCKRIMEKPEMAHQTRHFRNDIGRNALLKMSLQGLQRSDCTRISFVDCEAIIRLLLENALIYSRHERILQLQAQTIDEQDKIIVALNEKAAFLEKKIDALAVALNDNQ